MSRPVILSIAAVTIAAFGYVPLHMYQGHELTWFSAQDLAQGGTGFSRTAAAVFVSPEMLGFVDSPQAEVGAGFRWLAEQRTRMVYDRFENAIGEATFADNTSFAGWAGPLAGAYPAGHGLVLGAGIAPVYDFGYEYEKLNLDDFYNVVSQDRTVQSGTVYSARLGAAYRVLGWLSAGVCGGYLFGNRRLEVSNLHNDTLDVLLRETGSPKGVRFGGGLAVEPLPGFVVDAGFRSGVRLRDFLLNPEYDVNAAAERPWRARLAIEYRAGGRLPSKVVAEAGFEPWSMIDSLMYDVLSVRAGVEHRLSNSVRLRYGFGLEPLPCDRTAEMVRVGAGVGFDAGPVVIDLGALFTRGVLAPSMFSTPLTPADLRVYETDGVLAVTVSREF
ncbi:MAG: hypothetical protein JSU73_00410 [candidate division WOR-3 bacterium]|nr:MAG: hypothetical protein JSU73_00410 [candidate division WOR-3 bacterium]